MKTIIHLCSLTGCTKQADPKWSYHDHHFCCEEHLIDWFNHLIRQQHITFKPHYKQD